MKAIVLFFLMYSAAFANDNSFAITTKVTEYPYWDGKAGKMIREQTFRGQTIIRDRTEKDSDGDGVMDWFLDSFRIDGKTVYATMRTKSGSYSIVKGHGAIEVMLTESKTTGRVEQIAFLTNKGVLREMFIRNAKDEFEPLSQEEFAKAVQHSNEVSPFMESILDTIRGAKPKKDPNPAHGGTRR